MKTNRKSHQTLISLICSCLFVTFSVGFVIAQNDQNKPKQDEPVLVPLTAEESKLDFREIVKTQPDFTAKENFFFSEGFGGFSASNKIAKRGNQYRVDTGMVIAISELNKPILSLNADKTYEESVGVKRPYVTPSRSLIPIDLFGFEDISFAALGSIIVDGNKLFKIQAKSKEFKENVFLYIDPGKKNLITIIQVLGARQGSISRVQDVSFDVPKEIFDITGYKAVPKFNWNRVKTVKVIYQGKPASEAQVFRYDDFIFIHIEEFEDMLINLKTGIALTVVFQGELAAKDGTYIWRTKEDEAISVGEPGIYFRNPCKDCTKIKSDSNSVSVLDPKHKSQILLKLTW